MDQVKESMELGRIFGTIRRWIWLILLSTALAAVVGYLAQARQAPTYNTAATVVVGRAIERPNPTNAELSTGQQLAATYSEIARRRPIQEAAMAALGLEWLPSYSVTQVPNTQLLEIQVTDSDPQRAQAVANELARQLIAQSPNAEAKLSPERKVFIADQIQELEVSINETEARIEELKQKLKTLYGARDIASTDEEIAGLERKRSDYQATYASLLGYVEGGVNTVQIVEWAELPLRSANTGGLQSVLVVVAIGLLLSLGVAFLLDYFDDTFGKPDDIQNALHMPVLGGIMRIDSKDPQDTLITEQRSQTPQAETYRLLESTIASIGALGTLVVTSPSPVEGKSTTAANLGLVMAQEGKRVILVDADLRQPTLHKLFGVANGEGLSNALMTPDRPAISFLQDTGQERLCLLTSGTLKTNPAILIRSEQLLAVLSELKNNADVVLIDTPPVLAVADVAAIAGKVDGVLLIVDVVRTRRKLAVEALRTLQSVNANVLGIVLNRVGPQASMYHRYGYYYTATEESAGQDVQQKSRGKSRWQLDSRSGR